MIRIGYITNYTCWLVPVLALIITFNLLSGPIAAILAALGLLVILPRVGWPALLVSLSLFGGIFFSLFHQYLGLGLTFFQVIVAGLMVLIIIVRLPGKLSEACRRKAFNYLIWVGLVWILMLLNYLTGPRTDYSSYFIAYFLIYGTSYVAAGILVYGYSVKLQDIAIPSLLLFSCLFPLIGLTPLQMRSALDPFWGLREIEAFTAITHARLAGLLFVMLLIGCLESARQPGVLPVLLVGSLICLPVLWYSYTRQAVVAVLLTLLAAAVWNLLVGNLLRGGRQRMAVLLGAGLLAVGVMVWFFGDGARLDAAPAMEGRMMSGDSDHFRIRAWSESWNAIKGNPLTGYGVGWFAREHGSKDFDWPHNWFIEVWLEHGLAGLILFLIGSGFLLAPLFRLGDRNAVSWALAGLYWLIVVQLSGDIARNSIIFFFITVGALAKASRRVSPAGISSSGQGT